MSRKRKRRQIPQEPIEVEIESLSHDGRGVAHVEGKALFVVGALPGERVVARYLSVQRRFDLAVTEQVLRASPDRVEPRCAHFGVCGGCSLQHMDEARQIEVKQQTLLDNFRRLGGVEPEQVLPPLTGPHWGYRRKARLGVRDVPKKGRVLVGFREQHSNRVAVSERCEVLDAAIGPRLLELSGLIGSLDARRRIAQIEVAVGDNAPGLVFRNLDELNESDCEKLRSWGESNGIQVYLQPKGPDSVFPLWPVDARLYYRLPAYDVELEFRPTDFTQVNMDINRAMVDLALGLMELSAGDRVLDLFCGLGNFSLPMARTAAHVVGVEGAEELVQRAREAARHNGIGNIEFHAANLMETDGFDSAWFHDGHDKLLLDPPRSGAQAVCERMDRLAPQRIVYVSCHPGSLARDAGILVNGHGYRLLKAGVMDMFPHTAHVESIALFER